MKKALFSSLAMCVVASAAASAVEAVDVDVRVAAEVAEPVTSDVSRSVRDVAGTEVDAAEARAASTGTARPFYYLPGGALYESFILGYSNASSTVAGSTTMYVAPYMPLELTAFPYSTDGYTGPVGYSWRYQTNDAEGTLADQTSTSRVVGLPALYPSKKVGAPFLSINGGDPYHAADSIRAGGQAAYDFRGIGTFSVGLSNSNIAWFTANRGAIPENRDSLAFVRFNNITCGGSAFYYDTRVEGIVNVLKKPAAMFGIEQVVFRAFVEAYESDGIKVDIYEKIDEPGKGVRLGRRLGGGMLPKNDVPVNAATFVQVAVPIMYEMGELSVPSFINIDSEVFVVLSGWDNSKADKITILSVLGAKTTPHVLSLESYTLDRVYPALDEPDPENPNRPKIDWDSPGDLMLTPTSKYGALYSNGQGSELLYLHTFDMMYKGCYSWLNKTGREEGYYSFEAPAAGGSKTFMFDPGIDLRGDDESEVETVRFSGEGCDEWILVTPGAPDAQTGEQALTVEVDPLPDGMTSRKGEVIVEICGARQVIAVEQDVRFSGIGSVTGDAAATVSSACYDLAGRRLADEPASGLYIRKDVKADGSLSAVKVVK